MGNSEIFRPRRRLFHLGTFLNRDWKILCANILYFFISFYLFLYLFFFFLFVRSRMSEKRRNRRIWRSGHRLGNSRKKSVYFGVCAQSSNSSLLFFFLFTYFHFLKKSEIFIVKFESWLPRTKLYKPDRLKIFLRWDFLFFRHRPRSPVFFILIDFFFFVCLVMYYILASSRLIVS